ncbi:hypothetical protein ACFLTB_02020 [Chloroflexota bacterium]
MPKQNKRKRRFKPNQKRDLVQKESNNIKTDMQSSDKKGIKIIQNKSFTWHALSFIVSFYLSLVGENALLDINPTLGFVLPVIVISLWLLYLPWRLKLGWYWKFPIGILLVTIMWVSMPLYIDHLPQLGRDTIEFERPYFDSTTVNVSYGDRQDDFFWTDKTVAELKQKSSVSLSIIGDEIFNIYTDGRQVIVDAKLFAGYGTRVDNLYRPLGTSNTFSINLSGYLDTDARPNKFFARKQGAFEFRVDPSTDGTITATILGQPIILSNPLLSNSVNFTNNALSRKIDGWDIRPSRIGYEVLNEENIPVLVIKYENPYQITISGLFLTPLGVMKVDNNDDVIFEFANSPSELGLYTVDIVKPHTVFDVFNKEKTYNLAEIYPED